MQNFVRHSSSPPWWVMAACAALPAAAWLLRPADPAGRAPAVLSDGSRPVPATWVQGDSFCGRNDAEPLARGESSNTTQAPIDVETAPPSPSPPIRYVSIEPIDRSSVAARPQQIEAAADQPSEEAKERPAEGEAPAARAEPQAKPLSPAELYVARVAETEAPSAGPRLLAPTAVPAELAAPVELVENGAPRQAKETKDAPKPEASLGVVADSKPAAQGDAAQVAEANVKQNADSLPPAPMTGVLTGEKVNERARKQIREGYELAWRGATFAAEKQFVGVLHMIAEAKDALSGSMRRTMALTEGLRALEEADDFQTLPPGIDLATEVGVLVRSHRTNIGREAASEDLSPTKLADSYYQFAHTRLAEAVAGEPAGSMALHALGKLACQLHAPNDTAYSRDVRRAVAYQQAALLARDDNYLAAHELGVLMAETGHYPEAAELLRQVAATQPEETVLKNLARVERELGNAQAADAAFMEAARLAARSVDSRVAWVSPQQFAGQTAPLGPYLQPGAAAPGAAVPSPMPANPVPQMARRPQGPQPGSPAVESPFLR